MGSARVIGAIYAKICGINGLRCPPKTPETLCCQHARSLAVIIRVQWGNTCHWISRALNNRQSQRHAKNQYDWSQVERVPQDENKHWAPCFYNFHFSLIFVLFCFSRYLRFLKMSPKMVNLIKTQVHFKTARIILKVCEWYVFTLTRRVLRAKIWKLDQGFNKLFYESVYTQ